MGTFMVKQIQENCPGSASEVHEVQGHYKLQQLVAKSSSEKI